LIEWQRTGQQMLACLQAGIVELLADVFHRCLLSFRALLSVIIVEFNNR
jgi:hypothetical protein